MPDDSYEARELSACVASAAELLAANRAAVRGASEASVLHCAPALRGLPLRLHGPCLLAVCLRSRAMQARGIFKPRPARRVERRQKPLLPSPQCIASCRVKLMKEFTLL